MAYYPQVHRLLLILLLGACGSEDGGGGAQAGEPCNLTAPCGSGLTCDFTAPVEPTCVDEDSDEDGDGIPAKQDFCQHQPGGAFDEDGDYIGDDCDRCPIAPPPASPDADGDEVDSPCDPDPGQPGDKIVLFEGFNAGALPAGWTSTGAVTVQGGVAKLTATGATDASIIVGLPALSTKNAMLSSWRVDATDPSASENAALIQALDRRPAGITAISCGASRIGTSDRVLLDTGIGGAQEPVDELFDQASLYRAAIKLEGITAQCALIGDQDTGAVQAATAGDSPSEAALLARGATIQFRYLLVVQPSSGPQR